MNWASDVGAGDHSLELAILHRFLTDQRIPLRTRVASCLLLLYAQPVVRLVRLTVTDIITGDDGQVSLRLGSPPTPVPAPFGAMLTELAANRVNMNTATNPACLWLFPPASAAGSPSRQALLASSSRRSASPPPRPARSAFRQLVLQAPAPVVARALGYGYGYGYETATAHAIAAGGTWSRYPATHAET